jgi:hypothetical protein
MKSPPPSFWERQYQPQPTVGQIAFDLVFGIALPVICLYCDPIVFRASAGEPLFGKYILVAGFAIGLGFLSLSTWLLLRWPATLLVGFLVGGGIFAFLLGLVLLPYSLIGVFIGIGILGFSPFLTAFVFWRNAVRAYRKALRSSTVTPVLVLAVLGLVVSCGSPWAAYWYVRHETSRALDMVMSPDEAEVARGIAVLKRFGVFINFDQLVVAYANEEQAERRERLASSYKELTGEDIQHRLFVLRD